MPNTRAGNLHARGRSAALVTRLVLLALLWVTLVEGHPQGLSVGLLVLPLVAWASLVFEPSRGARLLPLALLRLLPLFAWQAVRGSFEVARRALHPRLPIAPGCLRVRCHVQDEAARRFLAHVVSLVPGSLAAEVQGDWLTLHLLDASPVKRATALAQLRELEARVAHAFGLPPPPRSVP
jgi:multicomponent Na+:H+ antiporter subunit E